MAETDITVDGLCRRVWSFGSLVHGPYGEMTFAADGRVTTRQHPAEHRYRLDGRVLAFLDGSGTVTSRLGYDAGSGAFGPLDGARHVLRPLLDLGPVEGRGRGPAVFVNTVPKAGTYLMYGALEQAGLRPLDLHVMDRFLHDNRGVAMEDIHFDPASREHPVGAAAIANVMAPREFVVGHLGEAATLRAVAGAGVQLVNVIREPRSMLLSFHAFRRAKVKPTAQDALWQSLDGIEGFKAFLLAQPIDRWLAQIEVLATFGPMLRHEDLLAGEVRQEAVGRALHGRLLRALPTVLGAQSATYLEGRRDAAHPWLADPDVAAFLEATGVTALSRRFWPELHQR